jgi:arylsulfatase A-like enzyme
MARSPDVAGTPDHLPRPDFHFTGQVGRTFKDSDPAQFPQPTEPPKGAPNIVLILLDDVGFGQFSTFGGGVPSPTMDRLAKEGVRYNHFHTTALCSPTRAALITGRNHHSTSFAGITELATGYDGYCCILPKNCGTVAEVLRQNGYMTAWIGKNHNTPTWETSAAGPFDRWANGLGFDYFYGFNAGDMSHWHPVLYENHNLVPASDDPDYHLTEDLADKAIELGARVKSIAPDKPFFLYVAPGATHAPHQAPKDWIDKFKGQFDDGWDAYREQTLERQKALGVVPKDTQLTERSKGLAGLGRAEPRPEAALRPDDGVLRRLRRPGRRGHGPGRRCGEGPARRRQHHHPLHRRRQRLERRGRAGGLAERKPVLQRLPREVAGQSQGHRRAGRPQALQPLPLVLGPRDEHPVPVDQAGGQPFRRHPQPLIISWPDGIKDKGGLRDQFLHVIDIVPTIYELAGVTAPAS